MMKCKKIFLYLMFLFFLPDNIDAVEWFKVFFSNPEIKYNSPIETAFIKMINNSRRSIKGAFYDISSDKVVEAFIKAKNRGCTVELVVDDLNLKKEDKRKFITKLLKNKIPLVFDNRRAFMHNKFAVFDERYTWTGSYNLSRNGAFKNNNNAILIDSPELSTIYLKEFNEMYRMKIFGNKKEPEIFSNMTYKYYVKKNDTPINAYFSPENNIERIIVSRIKKAKKSIYFMAFSFTSDPIGENIIKKFKSGVKVAGIFEKRGSGSKSSEFVKMKVEGLPVKVDKNPKVMHHKVIIIDEKIVITGSYNFSKNASKKNDENILVISNNKIANIYLNEFRKLYK